MTVPAVPAPHLVVVQAHFPLGRFHHLLDRPPRSGHPDEVGEGGRGRAVADVVGHLGRVGRRRRTSNQ